VVRQISSSQGGLLKKEMSAVNLNLSTLPIFCFIKDTPFEQFVIRNCANFNTVSVKSFSFVTILNAIYNVITSKHLFDTNNPAIVICNKDLEVALNVGAIHYRGLPLQIFKLIKTINGYQKDQGPTSDNNPGTDIIVKLEGMVVPRPRWGSPDAYGVMVCQPPGPLAIRFDQDAYYLPSENLYALLVITGRVDIHRKPLIYRDIFQMLSIYLLSNKDKYFNDSRNHLVVRCSPNDVLSKTFGGVISISRCQIRSFVHTQLSLPGQYNQHDNVRGGNESDIEAIYTDLIEP